MKVGEFSLRVEGGAVIVEVGTAEGPVVCAWTGWLAAGHAVAGLLTATRRLDPALADRLAESTLPRVSTGRAGSVVAEVVEGDFRGSTRKRIWRAWMVEQGAEVRPGDGTVEVIHGRHVCYLIEDGNLAGMLRRGGPFRYAWTSWAGHRVIEEAIALDQMASVGGTEA